AGTALAMQALAPNCQLYLAEPAGADDAARSFARGVLDHDVVPDTICDGLRAGIGAINFDIIRSCNARVLTVDDTQTITAMRLLWSRGKHVVEPSSATVLAAVLANPALFEGRKVGLILSGGNVDLDALPQLFALAPASAA
ncbi:MAG: pyridoxal-phosphate dependent enzyme, partial [Pseudomonadota bacterium]|nr:pyridoxal-phosphate dependent enzyme [Pseudomonadota bacterium]MDQ3160145.1 pyridoxal-phosphate dependent enzyme [Pseudomonadota bacterium]